MFSFIYSLVYISLGKYRSKYNINTNVVTGIVKKIEQKDDNKIIYIDDVIVYTKNNINIKIGYTIKVQGKLVVPSKRKNINLFDYKNYLYSKNIHYLIYTDNISIINNHVSVLYYLKQIVLNKINNNNSKKYLYAFILGDTSLLDDNIINSYKNNGITHLFAISGMHITFIYSILLHILTKIIKGTSKYYIIIFLLFIYAFLSDFSISIIRSILLLVICIINKLLNINCNKNFILALMISFLLIYNPYYIYNLGFIYSFLISYLLVNLNIKDNNYIINIFKSSLLISLITIPITINTSFSINLLSIILNCIFIPIVSFIVFPLSLLTFFIPYLSILLNFFINVMEYISLFFNNIKTFTIILCHISIVSVVIYEIFIIFIINKLINKKNKYIFFIFIVLFIHNNIRFFDTFYSIDYINVDQGDSILITFPRNKANILIDCPNNKAMEVIIPYLKSKGAKYLDYLIITHGDNDHIGGSIDLINNYDVKSVIFNCGPYNDLEKELIKVLDKKHIRYYSCIKELNIDKNKLYFLQTKVYDNENDNSNVIITELDGYKFMFMGDASSITEKEIMNKYNLPNIDVLKVGHHGSKTSSSIEFINEINPKYSVISVGKNNRYGHPNKEVLDNLNNSKIYRTDEDGSIMFKIKNNKLKIETCSP